MKSILMAALAVAAAPHACAQWQGALETAARHVTMSEYEQSGKRFVRESGDLPGAGIGLSYRADRLEVFGTMRVFGATISYDGVLQNGSSYGSETATRLAQSQLGLRYRVLPDTRAIAALEYDGWKRDIRGSAVAIGLREQTHSRRLLLGAEQTWNMRSGGKLGAGATLVHAQPERLRVQFSGVLDDASLRTRAATGYLFELTYQPGSFARLSLGAQFDYMKVPRSAAQPATRNGNPAGDITQPEHVRQGVTLLVRYLL
ncbi:MAG: hypothetical protein V4724_23020 [Pseudomonadota bacterium]